MAGHADGEEYREVLNACLESRDTGKAVFPISSITYFEIENIRQHHQRRDLREVIEELSGHSVVQSRSAIATLEIEAMADSLFGLREPSAEPVQYLGKGVAQAMGLIGGFRIFNKNREDVTTEVARSHPLGYEGFMRKLEETELELSRRVLEGPTDQDLLQLHHHGWKPRSTLEGAKRRANRESELVRELDKMTRWRKGKLRDVVVSRELFHEVNEIVYSALGARGLTLDSAFGERSKMREAFDSMPSFDVVVSLKESYHKDSKHSWTYNDIYDIDAMAVTLPYCDIVATDKKVANHIKRTKLTKRLNVAAIDKLEELPNLL